MDANKERFINYALNIKALEFIPELRKLKSGRMSPYFFNSGLFNTGVSINELALAYINVIVNSKMSPEVIFGPAYKGISLATSIVQTFGSGDYRIDSSIGCAFKGGIIIGSSLKDKTVLIVDDVMTTGTSSGEAVEIIKANGGIPIGCVIAFDRQECGIGTNTSAVQEFENKYNIPVYSAVTLDDLIEYLDKESTRKFLPTFGPELDSIIESMKAYKKQYGVNTDLKGETN